MAAMGAEDYQSTAAHSKVHSRAPTPVEVRVHAKDEGKRVVVVADDTDVYILDAAPSLSF